MGRLLRRDNRGSTAVIESVLVGFAVVAAVSFVAMQAEPPTTKPQSRSALAAGGGDALAVLSELPSTNPDAHENLLEELITDGLEGDCSELERKLGAYYPAGVVWGLYLEKGYGEPRIVCETGTPIGEKTTVFTTIQPSWSNLFAFPNVTQISGVAELSLLGSLGDIDPLSYSGVLVRDCYIDTKTGIVLNFENGYQSAFQTTHGIRFSGALTPEYVDSTGPHEGYSVPYDTSSDYLAYRASTLNLAQPVASYAITDNLVTANLHSDDYEVHPKYTLSGAISNALLTANANDRFGIKDDNPNKNVSETVTFKWTLSDVAATTTNLQIASGSLEVYNPVGVEEMTFSASTWDGEQEMTIGKDALWGTYVARLTFNLEEVNALGSPTGNVYVVNQLTFFNVNPPGWAKEVRDNIPEFHPPPVYRVTLSAGFPDWE